MKHYQVILLIISIWFGLILTAISLLIHFDVDPVWSQLIALGLNTICYTTFLFNGDKIRQLIKPH